MNHSFDLIKTTLSTVATLTHPDPAAELCLAVDASNTHVGATAVRFYLETSRLLQQEARLQAVEVLCF
jgi:hypothetical protein